MIAQSQTISEKSTIVRSKTSSFHRPVGRRDGSAKLPSVLGGSKLWRSTERTDLQAVTSAKADTGKLERLVPGLLTLIVAGYTVAVLVRIVAQYA